MKQKTFLFASFLLVIVIASIFYLQSCKRESTSNISNPGNDAMFVQLSMANSVAQNVNKSLVVSNTIDKSLLNQLNILERDLSKTI